MKYTCYSMYSSCSLTHLADCFSSFFNPPTTNENLTDVTKYPYFMSCQLSHPLSVSSYYLPYIFQSSLLADTNLTHGNSISTGNKDYLLSHASSLILCLYLHIFSLIPYPFQSSLPVYISWTQENSIGVDYSIISYHCCSLILWLYLLPYSPLIFIASPY